MSEVKVDTISERTAANGVCRQQRHEVFLHIGAVELDPALNGDGVGDGAVSEGGAHVVPGGVALPWLSIAQGKGPSPGGTNR